MVIPASHVSLPYTSNNQRFGAHNLFLLRGAHHLPLFSQLRCKTQTFKSFWYDTRTFTSAEERCVTSKVFKKRKLRVGGFRWFFTDFCLKKESEPSFHDQVLLFGGLCVYYIISIYIYGMFWVVNFYCIHGLQSQLSLQFRQVTKLRIWQTEIAANDLNNHLGDFSHDFPCM